MMRERATAAMTPARSEMRNAKARESTRILGAAAGLLVSLSLSGCLSDLTDFWAALRADAGAGGDADSDSDTDADADADSDADSDADADSDMDAGDDGGGCTDTETGTGPDADSDADTDSDADADAGIDAGADAGSPATCPPDMAMIAVGAVPGVTEPFCIDVYEASRDDATSTGHGSDDTVARSEPGVLPWQVYPMSATALATFQAACAAAGKRLCDCGEWYSACTGPDTNEYVWGDAFDQQACNNVGSCCQDYCDTHFIDPCDLSLNCGGTAYGCNAVTTTGSFLECTNSLGTYDICGNLWEICLSSTAAAGYDIRGGAFNCYSPDWRLRCTYAATWTALYAGFRCCRDPE